MNRQQRTRAPLTLFPVLFLLLSPTHAQAQKNITLGSTLAPQEPTSSWLSPSGDFAFGFQPIEGNSSFYHVIWFNKISDWTVAWYAKTDSQGQDRDPTAVQVPSGSVLQLTSDGALLLRDPFGTEAWNPKVTGVASTNMHDAGNFVLVGADGNKKWQAFDVPSDTILPNQALPCNPIRDKALRARLDTTDYSNGRFLLNVQTDGNLAFYLVAVPSGFKYISYRSTDTVGNGLEAGYTSP